MELGYDKEGVGKNYKMFCGSVDKCISRLYDPEISDTERDLLEKRVNLIFMMTDFSLSALEDFDDSFLAEARRGVDKRRMEWGHYKTSIFKVSPVVINQAYDKAWAEMVE